MPLQRKRVLHAANLSESAVGVPPLRSAREGSPAAKRALGGSQGPPSAPYGDVSHAVLQAVVRTAWRPGQVPHELLRAFLRPQRPRGGPWPLFCTLQSCYGEQRVAVQADAVFCRVCVLPWPPQPIVTRWSPVKRQHVRSFELTKSQ